MNWDYYPFGMMMLDRKFSRQSSYRYGFNGKENDNETTQCDYGFRIYDPRLARFNSVDPLSGSFPYYSPYQFAGNKPIWAIDLDGLEEKIPIIGLKVPVISVASESTCQGCAALQQALALKTAKPKLPPSPAPPTISQYNNSPWAQQQRKEFREQAQRDKAINGTTMDQFAAQQTLPVINTTKEIVQAPIRHGYGIYKGVKEGDGWEIAKNSALLALDAAPFLPKGTTVVTANIPSRVARIIPEEFAGSATLGAPTAADVFVVDAAAIKGITNSTDLAKRLTLLDANGKLVNGSFRVIEFDTPASGLASPFNRTNPGFVNGGKTAGGASEYVLPNLQVKELKNVTQLTIK